MEEFLYHTIVYQSQIGVTQFSYQKIKRILTDHINCKVEIEAFYKLLNLGVIDCIGNEMYALSPSAMLSDVSSRYTLGVNLPQEFISKYNDSLICNHLGLTVFSFANNIKIPKGILILKYNLKSNLKQLNAIKNIIKSWPKHESIHAYLKVERYDFNDCMWKDSEDIKGQYTLYKCYKTEYWYEYLFKHGQREFIFQLKDQEKKNMICISINSKKIFSYNRKEEILYLPKYVQTPHFLVKMFTLFHIFETGTLPLNNYFKIPKHLFMYLMNKTKLEYTLL